MKLSEVVKNEGKNDCKVMLCIEDKNEQAVEKMISLLTDFKKEHTNYMEEDDGKFSTFYVVSRFFVSDFKEAYKQAKKQL